MLFYPESFKLSTPTDLEIVVERDFNAPRELVFEAFTKPELVRRWLLGPDGWTMPVCEIDLRVGGAWRVVWRRDDGRELELTGVYRDVKAPERIVNTERWGAEWPESLNTAVFTESGGRTTITLTMKYASKKVRD